MSDDEDAKVKASVAKLGAEDRRLVDAQKFCPVLNNRLGSMGRPVKLVLNGQPVFLCCKGCEKNARDHVDATLATVEKLKAKVTGGTQHK